ncbi:MAG: nitrilase-related carbon-nitrogen hydrolase [Verrucomicrobium sp.]
MFVQLLQTQPAWEDRAASHTAVRKMLADQPPAPDTLVVLPEMFSTGFSMNTAVTAQSADHEDERFLAEMAVAYRATVLGGVLTPWAKGEFRNESVTFSPEGHLLARYAKRQLFSPGGETDCHRPGSEVVTFPWQGFTVCPTVCYDLRFPEIYRDGVKKGASLFVVIASWPVKRYHHWLTLLQARAIENLAYVVGVNRCGSDPHLHYNGRSVVISPHGHIIADAGEGEGSVTARLDLEDLLQWRKSFPALDDMECSSATI